MNRLQFVHFDGASKNITRQDALNYIKRLTDNMIGEDKRFDESLIGEPIVVSYIDNSGKTQVMFAIGTKGEKLEGVLEDYHIIDSAKIKEEISELSGNSQEIFEKIEKIQSELDRTQIGAGLNEDGTYEKNIEATYINNVNSLNEADVKLDEELKRIDEVVETLKKDIIKNIVVNEISGNVRDGIAYVNISGNSIPIGEYEDYHGKAKKPHPIHDNYSLLDAIKQLDLNFIDFSEKQTENFNGLHIVKVTTGLDTNIREAYDLVNKDGQVQPNSERILIYKDSALYEVYLGHVDDRLNDYTQPIVTPGTGDTALCLIYYKADGFYQLICINVETFLEESEFLDGLRVDNHKVYVRPHPETEPYLTVEPNGVKISGVTYAINIAKQEEEERAINVENNIQEELDRTQIGAGLNEDGSYEKHNKYPDDLANYIHEATSLDSADVILDRELKRVENNFNEEKDRALAAEESISGDVTTLAHATNEEFKNIEDKIENEITRSKTVENNIQSELDITQTGAGLNEDGTYKKHNTSPDDLANYIDDAVSLSNADFILDRTLNQLSAASINRFINVEESITNEVIRSVEKDNNIQSELDITQTGAGLNNDGTYPHTHTANYIDDAVSLNDADIILDRTLNQLSSNTMNEFTNVNEKIDAFSGSVKEKISEINNTITEFSAGTLTELETIKLSIENEINRATTTEENIINRLNETITNVTVLSSSTVNIENNLSVLSGSVEEFSAATENAINQNRVKSDDRSIVIVPSENGTDISVNIDGITIVKDNDGILSTKLSIKKLETPSSVNIKEEYALVDNNGNHLGETVKIYKESSLESVELITIDEKEYLRFTYLLSDGTRKIVDVDVSSFLSETEFKDGLKVENSKVYVLIDNNSEPYLSVSSNGIKISGITYAINTAVENEKERALAAETELGNRIEEERNRALAAEESISGDVTTLAHATNEEFKNIADKINNEIIRATNSESLIRTTINTLSASVESNITRLDSKIQDEKERAITVENELNSKIQTEKERAMTVENELNSKIQTEELARQNGDTLLDGKITNEITRATSKETELQTLINSEVIRATNAENLLQTAIENEVSDRQAAITDVIRQYTNAITEERTSRIDTDERLERMITGFTSSTDTRISQLTEKINNEITRATDAENSISGSVNTFSSSTVTEINNIKNSISGLTTQTITGNKAISVSKSGNDTKINLNLNSTNKILSQDDSGLNATLTIATSSDTSNNQYIVLKGVNNEVISSINVNNFVKDGMLENVQLIGTNLLFTFNTASGKSIITVPLESLADTYTVSANSTSYLVIDNYKIGVKVDVDGGLASYSKLLALSGSVITLSGVVETHKTEINTLKDKVSTLENKVSTLETTINNLDNIIETKVREIINNNLYESINSILQGTTNEISVTGDSTTSKITISFDNPYTIGQHDNTTSTDY